MKVEGGRQKRRQQEERKAEKKKEGMSKSKIPEDGSIHTFNHPSIHSTNYLLHSYQVPF